MADIDAVLWDLDGTLIDSEPLWMQAEARLAAIHRAPWTHEDGLALVGGSLLSSATYVKERMSLDLAPDEIVAFLVDDVVASLRAEITWRPGALDMLEALVESQMPLALVTMSYRAMTDVVETAAPVFDAVISGDEVAAPKPDPNRTSRPRAHWASIRRAAWSSRTQ